MGFTVKGCLDKENKEDTKIEWCHIHYNFHGSEQELEISYSNISLLDGGIIKITNPVLEGIGLASWRHCFISPPYTIDTFVTEQDNRHNDHYVDPEIVP